MKQTTVLGRKTLHNPLIIKKLNFNKLLWGVAILPFIVFFTLPIYLTLVNSFKSTENIARYPLLPMGFTFNNYIHIITDPNIAIFKMYMNSILITSISIGLTMLTSPLAAYYIARSRKSVGQFFTMFFLMSMMIPPQITLVPLMSMFAKLHLSGTIGSIIITYGVHVFITILYSKFVVTIPIELEESAYLDGASRMRIFVSIVMPLLKPMTATAIIITGLGAWNDFIQPMMLLRNFKTITYGIFVACSVDMTDYGFVLAFVVLASIPVVTLFVLLQKLFMEGMTSGALKG